MNEPIIKREGVSIRQTLADREWQRGIMISTVTMADNVGYAVIRTEHGEYDLVPFATIKYDGVDK